MHLLFGHTSLGMLIALGDGGVILAGGDAIADYRVLVVMKWSNGMALVISLWLRPFGASRVSALFLHRRLL